MKILTQRLAKLLSHVYYFLQNDFSLLLNIN